MPVSSDAPAMRAALETVVTLFAFAGAWLVRAEFGYSRRLRDLLLLGALLTFGLVHLCWRAVPAALDVHAYGVSMAAGQWGALLVAAMLVAAAFAGPDGMVADRRSPVTWTAAISVLSIVVTGLAALLARVYLTGTISSSHGIGGAAWYPLALVLALGAGCMLIAAGWDSFAVSRASVMASRRCWPAARFCSPRRSCRTYAWESSPSTGFPLRRVSVCWPP